MCINYALQENIHFYMMIISNARIHILTYKDFSTNLNLLSKKYFYIYKLWRYYNNGME